MQQGSPDALFAAIAQSGNEVTQGWMRIMAGAPAAAGGFPLSNASLQRDYFEKQARLWSALASGKRETLASPEPGDRRFAAKEWRENAYYDYLKQSYLLAARYLEAVVESAQLEPKAKERARFAARRPIPKRCARRTRARARVSREGSLTCWPTCRSAASARRAKRRSRWDATSR
jgi:hypothetical protein